MKGLLRRLFGAKPAAPSQPTHIPVEPPADAQSYRMLLDAALAGSRDSAAAKMSAALDALPKKTRGIDFGVHPAQDADGSFSVMIHLDGPDLYVLNKAIAPHREIFDRHHGPDGNRVPLPYFDPDETGYDVNTVIASACYDWVADVWRDTGQGRTDLPVSVFLADDFGEVAPRQLQGTARG